MSVAPATPGRPRATRAAAPAPGARAVVVCAQLPAREAPQAGHKTAFSYLAEVSQTHRIDLLVACKFEDLPADPVALDDLRRIARSVTFVPLSRAARWRALFDGLRRGIAPRLATRCSRRLAAAFDRLLADGPVDLVWLEFSQVFWLAARVPPGLRTVLSAHDIQTQVVAGMGLRETAATLGLTYRCEKRLLDRADLVRVQSTKDAALLESFFRLPAGRIDVAPPALSTFLATLRRTPQTIEAHSILFWGAMSRPENADAAIEFAQRDFPRLLTRHPDARLYVVGSQPTAAVRSLAGPAVTVTGFVADPTPYFERCAVGIAPLTSGAGVKVKVLEMLAAGIRVVSTPIGAEGIPANALLAVAERTAFVEAIDAAWQ